MLYLLVFIISLVASLIITPATIAFARKFSLVDSAKKRVKTIQTHKGTIPRAGGIALGAAFIFSTLIFIPFSKIIFGITTAVFLTVLVGIIDDIRESSPYSRLIANIFTAGIIVVAGIGIPFITNPFNGVLHLDTTALPLAEIAAILWIVWMMNIVGWSGGVDGQLPGFVAIAAFIIGILSFRFSAHDISQQQVAILAFVTSGIYSGFLPWNFYPQKIMPGYSGKSLAGLLLAVLAILSGAKLGTAILVLSIPLVDAGFILIKRLLGGKSPFIGDKQHLHHKLLERGWGRRKIAVFYWLATAGFGFLALNLTSSMGKFFAAAVVIVASLMVIFWLHYSSSFSAYREEIHPDS